MANNVSTVSFGDYSSEQQDIERRRKMAEALQQQSMQPINNPMSGGYVTPISWTQGLAKMLQAYGGRKGQDEATERQKALTERSKTEAMDFVSTLPQATTQDMNLVANDDEGNMLPPAMKTTQPDQRAMADALRRGMASGNPLIAQMVGPMYAQMLKQNDPYTLAPNAVRMQGDQVIAQGNPQQFRPPDPVRTPQATPMAPGRIRDVQMGTDKVTQELQPDGTWKEIGRGPAFARQVAPVVNVGREREDPLVSVIGPDGKPVLMRRSKAEGMTPASASGRGTAMTATAQKEIIQTDEEIQAGKQAKTLFDEALKINDSAMGFTGAAAVASVGSLLPDAIRPSTFDSTQDLDNIVQNAALPQLKTIFGGNPTEGERKILLDVQGSSSKPPPVRKAIFERAQRAIDARLGFAVPKAASLRDGTYFATQPTADGMDTDGAPPPGAVREKRR